MQETKPLPQAAIVVIRLSTRSRLWMLFSEVIKAKAEMEVAGDEVDAPSEPPVKQINDEASGEGNGEEEGTTETSESTRKQTTQATEKDLDKEDGKQYQNYFVETLYTMANSLVDPKQGFKNDENLKMPLTHFKTDDLSMLDPLIEKKATRLFSMYRTLRNISKNQMLPRLAARKGIIRLPGNKFKFLLCKPSLMDPSPAKAAPAKRPPPPYLLNENESHYSEEKLNSLRAPLDAGWKREIVMRSAGSSGRKKGDVYYYQPKTNWKFRSSMEIKNYLLDNRNSPFTVDNFSFAKVRIGRIETQETVRVAYDRKRPVKAPLKTKAKGKAPRGGTSIPQDISSESVAKSGKEPVKIKPSSRGRIQPPKGYSGGNEVPLQKRFKLQRVYKSAHQGIMQMGINPPKYPKEMEDTSSSVSETLDKKELGGTNDDLRGGKTVAMKEIGYDPKFQVSVTRQSGSVDVDMTQPQLGESPKQVAQRPNRGSINGGQPGTSKRTATGILCSVRCAGMKGAVPNLQCDRCLCLFHAECLVYPSNDVGKKSLCNVAVRLLPETNVLYRMAQ